MKIKITYIILLLFFSPIVIFTQNDIKNNNPVKMHGRASQRVNKIPNGEKKIKKNNGFTSAKIVKKENVSAAKMIIYSYIAFFMLILIYILFVSKKINSVSEKLAKLESFKE